MDGDVEGIHPNLRTSMYSFRQGNLVRNDKQSERDTVKLEATTPVQESLRRVAFAHVQMRANESTKLESMMLVEAIWPRAI